MKRRGFLEAGIARELDISRQTVHKAADVADSKVSQALMETARLNKIKLRVVNPAIEFFQASAPNSRHLSNHFFCKERSSGLVQTRRRL